MKQELTEIKLLLEIRKKVSKSQNQTVDELNVPLMNELEKMIIEKEKDKNELTENVESALSSMIDHIETGDLELQKKHAQIDELSEYARMEMDALEQEIASTREERDAIFCELDEERVIRMELENRILVCLSSTYVFIHEHIFVIVHLIMDYRCV
jgi:SMC interacting uncharacterized protein involved in chromosome segregation